jgi:hypothetical protein
MPSSSEDALDDIIEVDRHDKTRAACKENHPTVADHPKGSQRPVDVTGPIYLRRLNDDCGKTAFKDKLVDHVLCFQLGVRVWIAVANMRGCFAEMSCRLHAIHRDRACVDEALDSALKRCLGPCHQNAPAPQVIHHGRLHSSASAVRAWYLAVTVQEARSAKALEVFSRR